jgi:hypothetical protein
MANSPWSPSTLAAGYAYPAAGGRAEWAPTPSTLAAGYASPAAGGRAEPASTPSTLAAGYASPAAGGRAEWAPTPSTLAAGYASPAAGGRAESASTLASAYNAPHRNDERLRRPMPMLASRYNAVYGDNDDQSSHRVAFGKMKVYVWSDSLFKMIETIAFLDTGGEGESCNLISKSFLENDLQKEFYDKSDAMSWPGAGGEVKACGSVRLKVYPFRLDKRTGEEVQESPVMIKFYVYDHDEYPQWGDLNIGKDCLERNGWWWSLKLEKKLSDGNVIACPCLGDKY